MAWVKHNETSAIITAGAGSQTVTLPGTPAIGDLVLIAVAGDISCQNSIPSDYTRPENATGANPGACFGYKVLTAGDTTVDIARNATVLKSCVIQIWRGGNAAAILDSAYVGAATGTSANPDPPSIDTNSVDALVVTIAFLDDDDTTLTSAPSTYTNAVSGNTGQASTTVGATVAIASKVIAAPGTEAPAAFTMGSSDAWLAASIAFQLAVTVLNRNLSGTPETLHVDDGGQIYLGTKQSLTPTDSLTPPPTLTGGPLGDLSRNLAGTPETLHVSEDATETLTPLLVSLAETLHVTETATIRLTPLLVSAAETLHISESATVSLTPLLVSVSETLHVSDGAASVSLTPLLVAATEALHVVETAPTVTIDPLIAFASETLHVSETLTPPPQLVSFGNLDRAVDDETLHISEAATVSLTPLLVAASESLHVSDATLNVSLDALLVTSAETLHVGDSLTPPLLVSFGDLTPSPAPAETLHVSETASLSLTPLLVSAAESLVISESATLSLTPLLVNVAETLHVSESLTPPPQLIAFNDLVCSDLVETLHVTGAGLISLTGAWLRSTDSAPMVVRVDPDNLTAAPQPAETLHIGETVTASMGLLAVLSETLHLSEGVDSWAQLDDGIAELLHASETIVDIDLVTGAGDLNKSDLSETLHVDDALASFVGLLSGEGVRVSDADLLVVLRGPLQVQASEALHAREYTDSVIMQGLLPPTLTAVRSETLHVDDAPASYVQLVRGDGTEAIHVSYYLNVVREGAADLTPTPPPAETLHISEAVTARLSPLVLIASETLHVTETITDIAIVAGLLRHVPDETLRVTETLTLRLEPLLIVVAPETLHISETATARLTPLLVTASETVHVSETITDIRVVAAGELNPVVLAEPLHVTEALTPRLNPLLRMVTETVRVSESATVTIDLIRAVTGETLHSSDTVTAARLSPLLASGAETLHISESVTASMGLMVAVGETLHISEAVTVSLTPLRVTVPAETLHVTDPTPSRFLDPLQVSRAETIHANEGDLGENFFIFRSEAVDLVKSLSENLHVVETVTRIRLNPLRLAVAETVHVSETVTPAMTLVTVLAETLHVSESATVRMGDLSRTVTGETIHARDPQLIRAMELMVVRGESRRVTDTITRINLSLAATVAAETLHVAESATVTRTLSVTVAAETVHVSETVTPAMQMKVVVATETLHVSDSIANAGTDRLMVTVPAETVHVSDRIENVGFDLLFVTLPTETIHVSETVYPQHPPVMHGIAIFDTTIPGVAIFDTTMTGVAIFDETQTEVAIFT